MEGCVAMTGGKKIIERSEVKDPADLNIDLCKSDCVGRLLKRN